MGDTKAARICRTNEEKEAAGAKSSRDQEILVKVSAE